MGVTSELRLEFTVRSENESTHPIPVSRQNLPRAAVLKILSVEPWFQSGPLYFLINFYWHIVALQC